MSKFSDARQFEQIFQGLVAENPLGASENPINAYGPCWCKSGKKWKFCHKSRRAQKQLPFGQIRSLITEAQAQWVEGSHFCLHPSASAETCSPKVIGSHTVQRNGGLSAIAEDNHVLSTKKGLLSLEKNDGDIVPARIGLKDASTFPGFCNKHDTSMFLPAEGQDAALNKETAFLLSFRALAYEYVMKQYNIASHGVKRDNLDRGVSFAQQVAVQSWIDGVAKGTRMALDDIGRWKAKYDSAYINQDYSGYRAYFVEFDSVLPFVGAGAFMPEFDFLGNTLQSLGAGAGLEHVAINVTVLGGKTVAAFGWWPESHDATNRFVESFAGLPDDAKASALATCAFEHLENVYYRESWWKGLSTDEQRAFDELIRGGLIRKSSDSLSGRNIRVRASVAELFDLR
ncbi:hypothetical protein PQR34_14345 [Paraburkholderia sediminicola]|uniref:hypothetical protein n=1 Tax=Paraburkholderia sediminicola TaxID=458836 RepID=UPI0038BB1C25